MSIAPRVAEGYLHKSHKRSFKATMQLHLTGPLRQSTKDGSTEKIDPELPEWLCALCGAKNVRTGGDGDDLDERCGCCSRLRFPNWLRIEEEALRVGDRVCEQIHDEMRVGVITSIHFVKRQLSILFVSRQYHGGHSVNAGLDQYNKDNGKGKLKFEQCVLGTTHLKLAKNAEHNVHIQELLVELNSHGLCGDCFRVFRISEGTKAEAMDNFEAIRLKRQAIKELQETKTQHIKLQEYTKVPALNGLIKTQNKELELLLRKVEFLDIMSCPFCGWIA